MKKKTNTFLALFFSILFLNLTSCSSSSKKAVAPNEVDFSQIDSVIRGYDLQGAIQLIDKQTTTNEDSLYKLRSYKELLTKVIELEDSLDDCDKDRFVKTVINLKEGDYEGAYLFVIMYEQISHISLSFNLEKGNSDFVMRCNYHDKYRNNLFTDISIISDGKKFTIAEGSPVNGFTEEGQLNNDLSFTLSSKEIKSIANAQNSKLVFTTAQTYNDRAYLNGTIWDIKGGEPIKYNNIADFKARKSQIFELGEAKKFEIRITEDFKKKLDLLFQVYILLGGK